MKKWLTMAVAVSLGAAAWAGFPSSGRAPVTPEKTRVVTSQVSDPMKIARSIRKSAADAFTLPAELAPTTSEAARFVITDANCDETKWLCTDGQMQYGYHSNNKADDWFFIPLRLEEADRMLRVTFSMKPKGGYEERLQVCFGASATPAGMSAPQIDIQRLGGSFQTYTADISAAGVTGTGYLGFHAVSERDKYGIQIKDITVISLRTPLPLEPVITASAISHLDYTATVTLPDHTVQGDAIEGTVGLQVCVDGVEVQSHPNCTPGAPKEIALTLVKGIHTVSYAAFLTNGGETSWSTAVSESVRATSPQVTQQLPALFEPEEDDFDACLVIDANNDNSTWEFYGASFRYNYNSDNAGDDWLILPEVDFGADGGTFEISMDVAGAGNFHETFEVAVARTADPADMTVVLAPAPVISTNWETRIGRFTLDEGGRWRVAFHATSPKDQYALMVKNIVISRSADMTPAAPVVKSLVMNGLEGTLAVTLPSVTVDGVGLTGQVGAAVTVDGEDYAVSDMAAPGADVTVPLTLGLGRHSIGVAAFVDNDGTRLTGAQVLTEVLARNPEGYAYPLPFTMHPTAGEFETLTVLDANADGHTWDYNAGAANGTGAAVCRTAADETSDDWIFFPAVQVDDITRVYRVSAEARAYLEQYPEDFDICIGTAETPDAMTVVAAIDGYKKYLYESLGGEWIAPAPGKYHVGLHRRSAGTAHTLSVMTVSVADAGKSVLAPAACTDIDAAGDPSGALTANVTLTLPLNAINGTALDASAMLTATVTSATGATATVTGRPGQQVSVSIAAPDGHSTLTIVVSSDQYGAGEPAEVSVFCGLDRPSAPVVTAAVSEDNMELVLTWTDPDRGEQGGAIDTSALRHVICTPVDEYGFYWTKLEELPAGQNSYTFTAELLQNVTIVGVQAVNAKGESQMGVGFGVTGTPYSLPMTEDLSRGVYTYNPVVKEYPAEGYSENWFLDKTSLIYPSLGEDAPSALMCIESTEPAARHGRVALPKFTTVGAHSPKVTLRVYDSPKAAAATVYASSFGMNDVTVGVIPGKGEEGWKEYTFDLAASLVGKSWVNLSVEVDFDAVPQAFVLGGYKVCSTYADQLSTRLSAPAKMDLGNTYTLKASVTNGSLGAVAAPAYNLTVAYGDESAVLATGAAGTGTIDPGATVDCEFTFAPVAEMLGDARITFALDRAPDELPEDDSDYADVLVGTGGRPVVTDLVGSPGTCGDMWLMWSVPAIAHGGTDDFEDYVPFDFAEELGAWRNFDGDGKKPYAIGEEVEYPGYLTPKAFQVVRFPFADVDIDLHAFSGHQYLLAVCPDDGSAADDWLISPEVMAGSKVSFRFNILNPLYGTEQIDLMYSSTGREPEDFTLVQTFSQNMRGWNPLEATLPADARYFAFHYRSKDIFGVALDDISYHLLGEAPIKGYNIYRNGEKIESVWPDTSYQLLEYADGDRFNVAVVADNGGVELEHPMSNTFVIWSGALDGVSRLGSVKGVRGAVVIEGMEGAAAEIVTPDGRVAASASGISASESVPLPAGIYVVRISGGVVAKVRVN